MRSRNRYGIGGASLVHGLSQKHTEERGQEITTRIATQGAFNLYEKQKAAS